MRSLVVLVGVVDGSTCEILEGSRRDLAGVGSE